MSTKIVAADGVYDLSDIKNAKHLKEEINLLKASLKKDEQALVMRFKKMPQVIVKTSADAVLPSFINKMIANGSWKIVTSSLAMLVNPFSKKAGFGKKLLGAAKKLGLLAVLKGAYNMWQNKKTDKPLKPATLKTVKPVTKQIK